jgi:hypothetical protein
VLLKVLLSLFLLTAEPGAAGQVELFDTDEERVVKTYENSDAFQKQAQAILDSVSGRVLELNPSLEKVMIAKIPLAPPKKLAVQAIGVDTVVTDMFVVMPKQGSRLPWLILHNKENETLLLEFTQKVDGLKQLLDK